MVYIAFDICKNCYSDQHEKAYALLKKTLLSLGCRDIEIKKDKSGRPYCNNTSIDFSVSHTSGFVAVALVSDQVITDDNLLLIPLNGKRIGVDIEKIDKSADIEKLRRLSLRFLNNDIHSHEEFYRLWTRNEAYGKMTGEGVINKAIETCDIHSFTIETEEIKYSLSISVC